MLCSFIVEADHKLRYDSIVSQNWHDFELLYVIPADDHTKKGTQRSSSYTESDNETGFEKTAKDKFDQIDANTQNLLQHVFCKTIPDSGENLWNDIISQARGEYIAWIPSNELWAKGFLDILREKIQSHQSKNNINNADLHEVLAGYGFVRTKHQLTFAGDYFPLLLKENRFYKNLRQPKFYNPFIKYFFSTKLIRANKLPNDYSIETWQERYAVFCLRYLLALYSLSGGREPDIESTTLPFSLPFGVVLDTNEFGEYQSLVESERERLKGSIFEAGYWVFAARSIVTSLSTTVFNHLQRIRPNMQKSASSIQTNPTSFNDFTGKSN